MENKDWILGQLKLRGYTPAKLARELDIRSSGFMSNYFSGKTKSQRVSERIDKILSEPVIPPSKTTIAHT